MENKNMVLTVGIIIVFVLVAVVAISVTKKEGTGSNYFRYPVSRLIKSWGSNYYPLLT